jgi:hypothetical protein
MAILDCKSETGGEGGTLRQFGTIRLFSWKNQQIRRFGGILSGLQSGLHFAIAIHHAADFP